MKNGLSFKANVGNRIMLVCADRFQKKLYVTSETFKESFKRKSPAARLIKQYHKKYPNYRLEINDEFFRRTLFA